MTSKMPLRVKPIVWTIPHEDGGPIDVVAKSYADTLQTELDMHKTNSSNFLRDLHATQKQLSETKSRLERAESLLREGVNYAFDDEMDERIWKYFSELEK